MEQLTLSQFREKLKEHWPDMMSVEFICPSCKTVQTGNDLVAAGAGNNFEEIQGYIGFSCIGRFDKEKGCDWTLGGLFQIHELEIIADEDPTIVRPCFEINLPEKQKNTTEKQ